MILADTSVWIDHFRTPSPQMRAAIAEGWLLVHEFVIGEIAIGLVRNRETLFASLAAMPQAITVSTRHLLDVIAEHKLEATGLGLVDVHLLASALRPDVRLWTHDKRLALHAERLGVAWLPR